VKEKPLIRSGRSSLFNIVSRVTIVVLTFGAILFNAGLANAQQLNAASVAQTDPRISVSSNYTVTVSNVQTVLTRCIKEVYATTATGTTVPPGFVSTAASVNTGGSNYVAFSGWTLTATTNGTLTYTLAGGATTASAAARTFEVDGVTNGNTSNTTYFLQFSSYSDAACTVPLDNVVIAYVYTDGQSVSVTVDPVLTFAVASVAAAQTVNAATTNVTTSGTTVPLGTPTISTNQIGAQDITVTTNAGTGYTVSIRYTGQLSSAGNLLTNHTGTNAAPTAFSAAGTEAFGYTTNDGTLGTGTAGRFTATGGNKWAAFSTTNAEVAFDAAPVSAQTTRIGFQVGIAGITKAGTYTTTVIYTATPIF
jgi:hypothetical protein